MNVSGLFRGDLLLASIPKLGHDYRQRLAPHKGAWRLLEFICLEPFGSVHSLEDLVRDCTRRNF